jgi:hypothetical protein
MIAGSRAPLTRPKNLVNVVRCTFRTLDELLRVLMAPTLDWRLGGSPPQVTGRCDQPFGVVS